MSAHRTPGRISVHLRWAIALLVAATAQAAPPPRGPSVKIEAKRVIASAATPGSDVAFLSVGLASDGYNSLVVRAQEIVTAKSDGTATLEQPRGVPWRSIWVVVDTRNGQFTITAPDAWGVTSMEETPILRRSKGADVDEILLKRTAPFLYYIHANGNVWAMDAGGALDGVVAARLSDFSPVGPAKDKPKGLAPGGILIVFDYYEMEVLAVKLDGGMLNGGGK